ncbi:MAG: cell division protein FtsQ/DivIB [Gaiellaceae bacterium]
MSGASRSKQPARAAVLPFPRQGVLSRGARLLPSGRALVVCLLLAAAAVGVYVVSRETSLFAIRRVEVRGVSPAAAAEVRQALAPLQGSSLLALGGDAVTRRVGALPDVLAVTYDRGFPHTLTVTVTPERPVAVLRRADESWLVSARGRIMRRLTPGQLPGLARIWVNRQVDVSLAATLSDPNALSAVAAVAPLVRVRFPVRVTSVETKDGSVTLHLRSGLALVVGDTTDLRLKYVIAKQLLPSVPATPGSYLDVSVPERPVSGTNSQVGGLG